MADTGRGGARKGSIISGVIIKNDVTGCTTLTQQGAKSTILNRSRTEEKNNALSPEIGGN